ncbi:NAD binding rossmann fold [Mycena sanguinolenta]|uniref:NAD binding rossmann fold n=1 Tax=Mycena sanguinolenta TaxID=230812 RepID=A0A8H7D111_9AGAR|nr:NAD binding rossmann fold [Mycena sanguinolenta]
MPLVDIRVDLPSFGRTIHVQVPDSGTVLDVKREIFRVCVGAPRVEGQRIIWRGRSLLDTEKVEELWKSPNEPRIVHLAVHPSAWSSTPPDIPQPPPAATPAPTTPSSLSSFLSSHPVPPSRGSIFAPANPLVYVLARHQQAFNALEQLRVSHLDSDTLAAKSSAVQTVERHGWSWPSILDEEFPLATEGGVKYERVVLEGQSYLQFVEGDQPTAIQLHALNVLASTFPILALPATSPVQTRLPVSHQLQNVPNVNALLQELGLPAAAIRNGANANLGPNIHIAAAVQGAPPPEFPLRPLLLPLFLLLLRTAVLLYFFAPARKPVFGILIVIWMLYEIWRPIREGVQRGLARAAAENANVNQANQQQPQQQPQRNGGAAPPAVNGQANAGAGPAQQRQAVARPGAQAAHDFDHQIAAVFDGFANYNIQTEEDIIRRGAPAEEPSFATKVMAFVTLFLTTMHPAVWNRRRAVLRQREGQIRMDANARAAELDENTEDAQAQARIQRRAQLIAQHEARPQWLRAYMERAVEGGWVDEAD